MKPETVLHESSSDMVRLRISNEFHVSNAGKTMGACQTLDVVVRLVERTREI